MPTRILFIVNDKCCDVNGQFIKFSYFASVIALKWTHRWLTEIMHTSYWLVKKCSIYFLIKELTDNKSFQVTPAFYYLYTSLRYLRQSKSRRQSQTIVHKCLMWKKYWGFGLCKSLNIIMCGGLWKDVIFYCSERFPSGRRKSEVWEMNLLQCKLQGLFDFNITAFLSDIWELTERFKIEV